MTIDSYPSIGPFDDESGGMGPEGESVENVRDELEQVDEMLVRAGQISGSETDQLLDASEEARLERDFQEYVYSVQDALGEVGLHRAEELTAEKIRQLDSEVLEQLNPYTAESLYFHVARRTRKWLGNEPVGPDRLISQLETLVNSGKNLEIMQLERRAFDLGRLYEIGFDPEQLLQLSSGTPGSQQTINRLAFFLQEPRLKEYVNKLYNNKETEGVRRVETVVIEAQQILKDELQRIEDGKTKDELEGKVDSIYADLYDRSTHRIGSAISIGELVLEELRSTTTYHEFLRQTLSDE